MTERNDSRVVHEPVPVNPLHFLLFRKLIPLVLTSRDNRKVLVVRTFQGSESSLQEQYLRFAVQSINEKERREDILIEYQSISVGCIRRKFQCGGILAGEPNAVRGNYYRKSCLHPVDMPGGSVWDSVSSLTNWLLGSHIHCIPCQVLLLFCVVLSHGVVSCIALMKIYRGFT